jgi:hypothetical protein
MGKLKMVLNIARGASLVCILTLAACGSGGGGGIASTPTPTPSPTPTNSSISNLVTSQVFGTTGASETTSFDKTQGAVINGSGSPSTISVSYDANTKSYTVSTTGRNQTFGPSDVQTGSLPGETKYIKTSSAGNDYLTLVTTPYTSTAPNTYVGMGYWQRNNSSGTTQNTTFDSFVYGFDTPASATPTTGSASYGINAFGLVTTPGKEPKAFSGSGTFDVDFLRGVFQTQAYVGESSLTSDSYSSGGTLLLQGAGHLSSGNGYSGNISYSGLDGIEAGTINGKFFGPAAQELGASFTADNANGAVATGSITGQVTTGAPPVTLTVDNIVSNTTFTEHFSEFTTGTDTSLTPPFRGSIGYNEEEKGTLVGNKDGSVVVTLANSTSASTTFTSANLSPSQRANFTSYDAIVPTGPLEVSGPVHLDLYKPGAANTELALTYTGFGIWTRPYVNGTYSQVRKDFLVYGLETPNWLLSRRTGSATYTGVVYGATTTADGTLQDVGGSSRFDVNFGAQSYTGSLDLTAQAPGVAAATSLGTWTFGDKLVSGQMAETALLKGGVAGVAPLPYNSITPRFYGPDGEEIGATFTIQHGYPGDVGTTAITGVAVAKRH